MILVYLYAILAFVIFTWAFLGRMNIQEKHSDARNISGPGVLEQARNLISQPSALVVALFVQRSIEDERRVIPDDRTRLSVGFRKTSLFNRGEIEEIRETCLCQCLDR